MKLKNTILKSVTWFFVVLFLLSICALDSITIVPYITCIMSLCWLVPFGIVNNVIR